MSKPFDTDLSDEFSRIVHDELDQLLRGYPMHPKLATWIVARSARIRAEERESYALECMRRAYGVK